MEIPVATRVHVFEIEGKEGIFKKVRQKEASGNTAAVRALHGSTVSCFVRIDTPETPESPPK